MAYQKQNRLELLCLSLPLFQKRLSQFYLLVIALTWVGIKRPYVVEWHFVNVEWHFKYVRLQLQNGGFRWLKKPCNLC